MKQAASLTVGLAAAALLAAQPLQVQGGKLYRWVDEQGQVHYSDKVPPEHAGHKWDVLTRQGIRTETVEAAKTPEQLAEEERLARLEEEERRLAEERAAQDRILLESYTSEDDIIMIRDGKIAAIEAYIGAANSRIEKLQGQLAKQQKLAAEQKPDSPNAAKLQKEISQTEQQIRENQDFVATKRAEQEELRVRYNREIQRFRELMGQRP